MAAHHRMQGSSECKCGNHRAGPEEFDAQLAIQRLSKKYDDLAQLLAAYVAQAPLPGNARAFSADTAPPPTMADALQRIVGGFPVAPGAFPECALIGRQNPNGSFSWFCTGALVHPRVVLTAAHCFDPTAPANVVALAAEDQSQLAAAELVPVRRMVIHPQYQLTGFHDIGVLILRTDATTAPVRVATANELAQALQTTLVGFGNDDVLSTRGFGIKREVTVPITHPQPGGANPGDGEQELGFESDLEFVAGGSGFDSCNGDSGGPAYIDDAGGQRIVAGLTSRATSTARNPCGEGGIYTRVDVHVDFIRTVAADAGIVLA